MVASEPSDAPSRSANEERMRRPRTRSRSDDSRCGTAPSLGQQDSLERIVAEYADTHRPRAGRELRFFAIQPTIRAAVERAARAVGPSGKRLKHQRRIRPTVLVQCARCLLTTLPEIEAAPDFESLWSVVRDSIGPIHGVGELMIYDTALRIAAQRGLELARVFLHAGVRVGAKALGLDWGAESLAPALLPPALQTLRPLEIEDVLCIYKDRLAQLRKSQ